VTEITKRPLLIWITQILSLVIGAWLAGVALYVAIVLIPLLRMHGSPWWEIGLYLVIPTVVSGLLMTLLGGLLRRRRWGWYGSIVFSIALFALVLYWRGHYSHGPILANEKFGAAVVEILIASLLALYPIRLFFSKHVRAFLGVTR
jgi:hypothetical protein